MACRACRRRRGVHHAQGTRVKILHAARTDVGMIRSGNEDNFTVDASGTRGIFIVADGMGGHAAGEVASEMAVQIVQRELVARARSGRRGRGAARGELAQAREPRDPRAHAHRSRQAGDGNDRVGADAVRLAVSHRPGRRLAGVSAARAASLSSPRITRTCRSRSTPASSRRSRRATIRTATSSPAAWARARTWSPTSTAAT